MSNSENFHLAASTFFQCFSLSNGSIRAVKEAAISCCFGCYVFITNAIIFATSEKSTCDLFVIRLCIVDRESYFVSVVVVALFISILVVEWPIQFFSMPIWFWTTVETHIAMSENFQSISMQKQYNNALKRPTDIMHRCTYNAVKIHTHRSIIAVFPIQTTKLKAKALNRYYYFYISIVNAMRSCCCYLFVL